MPSAQDVSIDQPSVARQRSEDPVQLGFGESQASTLIDVLGEQLERPARVAGACELWRPRGRCRRRVLGCPGNAWAALGRI